MRIILLAFLLSIAALTSGCQSTRGEDTGSEPKAYVVVLQHTGATEMAATLTTYLAQDGDATGKGPRAVVKCNAATNSLLICGSDERVAQVVKLISQLDVPAGS